MDLKGFISRFGLMVLCWQKLPMLRVEALWYWGQLVSIPGGSQTDQIERILNRNMKGKKAGGRKQYPKSM